MTTINHKELANGNTHMFCPDGLLSARPASPTNAYNPYYYATDTNQLFVYFGSAWVETSLNSYIGTCSTAAATAAKTLAISGFSLTTGAKILITFTNANTANTPTLNVESTGAKAIYTTDGVAVSATNQLRNKAGETIEFYYDGTNWVAGISKPKTANYAMPSDTVDAISLGASGSTYTAPANGWLCLAATTGQSNGFVGLEKQTTLTYYVRSNTGSGGNTTLGAMIPVKKGDVTVYRYAQITNQIFNFIYAVGEV